MANPVILSSVTHRNLRVITDRGAEYGENIHLVPVIGEELQRLVVDYPVCLMKDDETGQFGLCALLGFDMGENLYLQGNRWRASYIPIHVRRQPFLIGRPAEQASQGEQSPDAMIGIDLDSKRVQETEGEALFAADGARTDYLNNVDALLTRLINGIRTTQAFIDTLSEHDLIEPTQLNVTFGNGDKKTFTGIYTVHDGKLGELAGNALEELHRKGYLQASYLILASMGQVRKLIDYRDALQGKD